MTFARPLLLLLLLALPLWWWRRRGRPKPAATFSDVSPLRGVKTRGRWIAELPQTFRSVAIGTWVIAAAGPEIRSAGTEITAEGIAIVMAVDVSSSMLAEDFAPSNRLDVAKEQSISFVRARTNDRIGLVAFSAEAITRVPLTIDQDVLESAVDRLRPGELEDGTAIGTAIATAANRLRQARGESKIIVLLTDGENNRGLIDPMTAAEAAGALGIKVYTIGVGTEGEARMPIGRGPTGTVRYQTLPVRIDEELLRDVSATTGGRYFRATDASALSRIFQQIDELEKTPVQVTQYTQVDEGYRIPLLVGLSALALELLMAATVSIRVP
ncbi:MAG: VWA domain-containing protein [Gemmatimonadales bacterium]